MSDRRPWSPASAGSAAIARVAARPSHARHPDVHEHDVGGARGARARAAPRPSAASPTTVDVGLGVEQRAEARAHAAPGRRRARRGSRARSPTAARRRPRRRRAARADLERPAEERRRARACRGCRCPRRRRRGMPTPSSSTVTTSSSAPSAPRRRRRGRAPACRTTLVSASCTMRYAANCAGPARHRTVETVDELGVESRRADACDEPRRARRARPAGASGASPSLRMTPSTLRTSSSAVFDVSLMLPSAERACSGSRSMRCRPTLACTLICESAWPITSCSSRAMRTRSRCSAVCDGAGWPRRGTPSRARGAP